MTATPLRAKRAVPTMRDVAALAGVSTMTVSRTLHDDPRITDETKQRVRAALSELRYVRNDTARNLRIGSCLLYTSRCV